MKSNLQVKIGLGKPFLPMVASPVSEGSRGRGKRKSHENSAPAARQPSWLEIQGYEGMTIRNSFPDVPQLYDTEIGLSTIVL
jgi:hypothetical protein